METKPVEKLKFNRTYLNMVHRVLVNFRKFGEGLPKEFMDNAVKQIMSFDSDVLVDTNTYYFFAAPKAKRNAFFTQVLSCTEDEVEERVKELIEIQKKVNSISEDGRFCFSVFTQEAENQNTDNPFVEKVKISKIFKLMESYPDCCGIMFNPYTDGIFYSREWFEEQQDLKRTFVMAVFHSSVLDMQAEVVVNSANENLAPGGGGLNEVLFSAAGKNMVAQTKKLCACNIGEVKETGACYLENCEFVVHAVAPMWTGKDEDKIKLENCYFNTLKCLQEYPCAYNYNNTIAFSLLGAGKGGFSPEMSFECAENAITKWINEGGMPFGIYICCYTPEEYNAVMKYMENAEE